MVHFAPCMAAWLFRSTHVTLRYRERARVRVVAQPPTTPSTEACRGLQPAPPPAH